MRSRSEMSAERRFNSENKSRMSVMSWDIEVSSSCRKTFLIIVLIQAALSRVKISSRLSVSFLNTSGESGVDVSSGENS